MSGVSPAEAYNLPLIRVADINSQSSEPRFRHVLVASPAFRAILLGWPPGFSAEPHTHPDSDELFQVVEGAAEFQIGDAEGIKAEAGCILFAPRGVPHSISVLGDRPLLFLATIAPNL